MAKWEELGKKSKWTNIHRDKAPPGWNTPEDPSSYWVNGNPFFFIESKLFLFFHRLGSFFFYLIFAAICRITKSAVYLNTPLGFEFRSSKHVFVVPCHADPHLRGFRGRKFENIRPDSCSVTLKTSENVILYLSVFIFIQSTPTPQPTIPIHKGDGSENF